MVRPSRTFWLVAICVGASVAEAAAVAATEAHGAVALAPQAAALAPFGVFHDMRWLMVFASSWQSLVLEAIALVIVRGLLTGLTVRAAWPAELPPPPWSQTMTRGLLFTVAAAVIVAPFASILVAVALVPVSYLWFAAVPTVFCLSLLVHHGPVRSWWMQRPVWRSTAWTVATFFVLTIAGAALVVLPRAALVPVAAAAGVFNAVAWRGVVRALAGLPRHRFAPVAPVGILALTVAACVGAAVSIKAPSYTTAGGVVASADGQPAAPRGPSGSGQPVLMASGYGIAWDGTPASLGKGFAVQRFSYLGSAENGDARPYSAGATLRGLKPLVEQMRQQVNHLSSRTGRPVDIIAESEGSLVATAYLMTTPDPPVQRVVLLSPLVDPARATIPPPDEAGPGWAAGWSLRGLSAFVRDVTALDISPDSPFIRSVAAHGNALREAFGCPIDGVKQLAVVPLADAVTQPYKVSTQMPQRVVLALHGSLLTNHRAKTVMTDWLRSGTAPVSDRASLARRLASAAGLSWQAPDLEAARHNQPEAGHCQAARVALASWLGHG